MPEPQRIAYLEDVPRLLNQRRTAPARPSTTEFSDPRLHRHLEGVSVVGAGLPSGPVGADVAGGAEELREVGVEEVLGGGLGRVDGDVHRGADRAGAVADGDGDRADTGGELLVGEGPAARADRRELLVEALA